MKEKIIKKQSYIIADRPITRRKTPQYYQNKEVIAISSTFLYTADQGIYVDSTKEDNPHNDTIKAIRRLV